MATYMTATSLKSAPYNTNNSSVSRNICGTGTGTGSPAQFSTSFSQASKFSKLVLFNSDSRFRYNSHRLLNITCASKPTFTPKKLDVTIRRSSLITPEKKTERKSMFLSNIDQMLNSIIISTIFFFNNNPDFPPKTVIEMLETAYRKILVPYDFMAGRFTFDQTGRLEIDCNSAGAGFVVASSELSLADLGDLVTPNKDYEKLQSTQVNSVDINDQPLFILQVTSFKCGGFTLGVSFNHSIFDGIGSRLFLENLASLAKNQSLVVAPPQNNRHLLSARSPLQVAFPHQEYLKFESLLGGDKSELSPISSIVTKPQERMFYLSRNNILNLKDQAKMTNEEKVAEFNVLLAHIWRCIGLAKYTCNDEAAKKTISLSCFVNIRNRLRPRLPSSYTGNGIYGFQCTTTCDELEVGPFSRLVKMITESDKQLADEYIKSAIDNMQQHKGFMLGDIHVTTWLGLGLNDIMYPWGKPEWHCPIIPNVNVIKTVVFILPDLKRIGPKGVNIFTSLQPTEMEKFESLFDRFLGK